VVDIYNDMIAPVAQKIRGIFGKNEEITEAVGLQKELKARESWGESFKKGSVEKQKDDDILAVVNARLHVAKIEKEPYLPQLAMNRAWYLGNQWSVWDEDSGTIEMPSDDRTRIVINRIRSLLRQIIAKVTSNKPLLQALPPESGDPMDKDAAKVSVLALEYQLKKMDYRGNLKHCLQWERVEGKCYLGLYYDETVGDTIKATVPFTKYVEHQVPVMDPYGMPAYDETGMPMMRVVTENIWSGDWPADKNAKPIRGDDENVLSPDDLTEKDLESQFEYVEGDLVFDVIPLNELSWEPGALSLEKSRWVIHSRRQPIETIRSNPNFKNTELVTPDTSDADVYNFENSIGIGLFRSGNKVVPDDTAFKTRSSVVHTYYERKSAKYPNGVMVVWSGSTVLYKGELPVGEFPMVEIKELDELNRFVPISFTENLMSPQFAYNLARSQELEYVKQAIIGAWTMRENSVDTPPTGAAGEHIFFRGDREPKRVQGEQLPGAVFSIAEQDKQDLEELGLLQASSRGIGTTTVTSGLHAQLLIEADDVKLGTYSDAVERATQDMGNLILRYMRKFFVNERMLRIVGDNRDIQVKAFRGADLRADVEVVSGSSLTQSRTLKREEIFIKWKEGFYGDPMSEEARRLASREMDAGYSTPQTTTIEANSLQAKRENRQAANGEPISPPMPWQDHRVHNIEHTEWLVTDGIRAGEQAQMAMWEHMQIENRMFMEMTNPALLAQPQAPPQQQQAPPQQGGMMPPVGPEEMAPPMAPPEGLIEVAPPGYFQDDRGAGGFGNVIPPTHPEVVPQTF